YMGKRIIVCADGTWNQPESPKTRGRSTNVLRLLRAIKPTAADGTPQVVYYRRGVGTDGWLYRFIDGVTGRGLSRNVQEAYRFIGNNYDWARHGNEAERDRIYLFGFSRGAYTVRSLAGLIGTIGLIEKTKLGDLMDGYDYYRIDPRRPELRAAHPFHSRAIEMPRPVIDCVGVWDTVGALGVPGGVFNVLNRRFRFHNTEIGHAVRHAYQALAIDEHRKSFAPAVWQLPKDWRGEMEQTWFAGAHCNVGGGYADHALSDIALAWMAERAMRCGLDLDRDYLARIGFPTEPGASHRAAMGDEYKGLYRWLGSRHFRDVATPGTTIHASVWRRCRDLADYRPRNIPELETRLATWTAAHPDDRGTMLA
ncbi:DUF2235 domain-containing protein, partial [Elioraea tepidiphila]